jgi:hypothetical protein
MECVCGTVSGTTVSSFTRGIDPVTATTTNATVQFAHCKGAKSRLRTSRSFSVCASLQTAANSGAGIRREFGRWLWFSALLASEFQKPSAHLTAICAIVRFAMADYVDSYYARTLIRARRDEAWAEATLRQALPRNSDSALAHYSLGLALVRQQRLDLPWRICAAPQNSRPARRAMAMSRPRRSTAPADRRRRYARSTRR